MHETIEPEPNSPSSVEAETDYSWPFGAEHKRSRRILGAVLLVVLVAPAIWFCFAGEVTARLWHLQHGNTFDYEGVRFQIPSDHYVRCWSPKNCNVIYSMGYLRWRLLKPPVHWISLSYMTRTGQEKRRDIDQMRANAFHWKLLNQRKISMAGSELECQQYLQDNKRNYTISCYSSQIPIVVTYMGNGDPEFFYSLLSSAERP